MSDISKKRLIITSVFLSGVLSLAFVFATLSPDGRLAIEQFTKQYPYAMPVIIFIAQLIGNVVLPVSVFFAAVIAIPYVGWEVVAFASLLANIAGYNLAFWLTRRYRHKVAPLFSIIDKENEWEQKLSKNQKFWGFFSLKLIAQGLNDYLSYLAGLTTMDKNTFFWATFVYEIIIQTPKIYFIGLGFTVSAWYFILAAIPILLGIYLQRRHN